MATYVNNLRLKEITTGDEDGTWGTSTNTNLELIADSLGYNTQASFGSDGNSTTTVADGAADPARALYFKVTSGATLTATRELTIAPNTLSRLMWIENATTGSQTITIKQGSGGTVNIGTGETKIVYLDGAGAGAAVVDALANFNLNLANQITGTLPVANGGTGITSFGSGVATWLGTPSSANLATAVTDETGSGALVFGTSPSLTTPKITTGLQDSAANSVIPFDSNQFFSGVFSDKVTALGNTGTAKTITCSNGNVFTATLNGNVTLTLATPNGTSNRATSFTLILTNDGTPSRTVALAGGTFRYPGGSISRSTGANEVDIWFFFSPDGGTTWYVTIPMKDLS